MAGKSSFKKPENPKRLVDYDNTKLLFIEVLSIFIKEVTGSLFYRPLPPMLGDGESVDLFKLYLVVRENGGYLGVSENGLWGLVAEKCGFDSGYGLGLKLVYVKYLDALEKWMLRIKNSGGGGNGECHLGDVELDLKEVLVKVKEEKAKDGGNVKRKLLRKKGGEVCDDGVEGWGFEGLNGNVKCKLRKKGEEVCDDDVEGRSFEGLNESIERFEGKSNLDEEHLKFVDGKDDSLKKSSVVEEHYSSRKRKKGKIVNGKLRKKGEKVGDDGVGVWGFDGLNGCTEGFDGKSNLGSNVITRSLMLVDGTDDSLMKSSRKRKKGEDVNCKLRKKGEEVCDGVEVRGFEGSNGNTEGFDGKSTVKDIEENRNVVYDEEPLKFVDGKDGLLPKSSVVEEDSISRKRKKGENVNCHLRKKGEEVCDDIEALGFEGLNGSIESFEGKNNLDEEHLKFVDETDDSFAKSSMVEEDCISQKRKKGFDTTDSEQLCDVVEARGFDGLNGSTEGFNDKSNLDSNVITRSVVYEEENLKFVDGTDDSLTKSSLVEEDCISRKRKREYYFDLMKWVSEVARNPCDPAIGILPERSKWRDYGTEVVWKQVLLMRDQVLLKRDVDSCGQYSTWQIKQKMHPSMYDDTSGSGRLRCSQRVLSAKDHLKKMRALQFSVSPSSYHNDEDQVDGPTNSSAESEVGFWWKQHRKRIPVGPQFQADVPEWIEEIYESDSKWLGTGIWPLDKRGKKRTLIDRGPIGKGRQDTCGCKSRGSYDCIKFHLSEKRRKLKIDLGSAYHQWKFDSMGEEVANSWSREEERKFQDIVKSNPLSEEKSFWNEIFKFFPNKSRESLVSYYFNVFLLRRRGNQNRSNDSNVDSDDDESEYGPRFDCFGRDAKFSIFRSPKKSTPGSEVVHES